MPHLSVRFDDEALDAVKSAAERAGQSTSIWAREVLVRAAKGGKDVKVHPERAVILQAGRKLGKGLPTA